jgi:hypothetical protein
MLKGSGGNDIFVFIDVCDNGDTILDFLPGDKIDLSAIDANSATPLTNEAFSAIYADPAVTVHANSISYYYSGASTIVLVDTDGNTSLPEMQITIAGLQSLDSSNVNV